MASIRIAIPVDRPAQTVWAAVADAGAVHERLARGFVVDTQLHDGHRVVTFAVGLVAKELLVDIDEDARRIAYAVVESPLGLRHHHATMEVVADDDDHCQVVWVADLLPEDVEPAVRTFMEQGAESMQRTLRRT
jgi:hypothetical protein